MEFAKVLAYKQLFLDGLWVTLSLSVEAIVGGTVLGLAIGLLFTVKFRPLTWLLNIYVEIFRGCPLLLQLFMGYFGVSYLGYDISIQAATVSVFTLYGGAYIAEIIRSGLEAIPKGQWEAAGCLGLKYYYQLRDVILPQAFKIALPPLVGFYLGLIKDTSIASIIGYTELLRESKSIMNVTARPFETYLVAALLYFIICFPLSKFVDWTEKRTASK